MPKLSIFNLKRNQRHWLRNLLIALGTIPVGVLIPDAAHALNSGSVSIQMVTDDQLVVDSNYCSTNQGPRAGYVGFKITNNSGSTLNALQTDLSGLTNGFSLAGGQTVGQYIGTLAPGASRTVYWYTQYAIPCSFSPQTSVLTVTVKDANPGTVTGTGTIKTESYISANAGGQVMSSVLGPGYVAGQLIPYDVEYEFGGANAGDRYNLQPTGNLTYDASCFQLERSEILSSTATAVPVGAVDQLFFTASARQPGSGYLVKVRYQIRYLCGGVSTTARPYAAQTSGANNKKYTGNYESQLATSFPAGTSAFSVTKTASSTNLPNGGNVTYTVTISNTSNFDARVDKITDILPGGVTFGGIAGGSNITAANSSIIPATGATGSIQWVGQPPNYYTIPANSSIKLIYTANVPNIQGNYKNSVTTTTGQSTTPAAQATVSVGVLAANLTVTKTTNTPNVTAGGTGNYTITITNAAGAGTATNVNISDALPSGFTYASTGSVTLNGGATQTTVTNPTPGATNPSWGTFSIPAGGSVTIPFTVNIGSSVSAGTYQNPATATYTDPSGSSGTANYNSASSTGEDVTVASFPDLTIIKSDGGNNFTAGSTGNYSITVNNTGTAATSGTITFTDTLPTGLSVSNGAVSLTGTNAANWTCSASNNTITCTSNTVIAASGSSSFNFNVNVASNAPSSVTNTASVSGGGEPVANNGNNTGSDTTTITVPSFPDLTIIKSDNNNNFVQGSTGSYNITVNNTGTAATSGTITFTDTLPTGLSVPNGAVSLTGTNAANWTCSASNNTITCTSNTVIAASGSSSFNFNVNVASNAPSSVTNTASVSGGGEPVANNGNNTGSDTTTIISSAASNPNVLLVKRITAINELSFTDFIDGVNNSNSPNYVPTPRDTDDNNSNWQNNYLQGRINGGTVRPNDEIEYTIYFLSAGDATAPKVLMCDRVPNNVSFIPTTFNSFPTKNSTGLEKADRGILWQYNGNTESLSNIKDGDVAQYFPPGEDPTDVYPTVDCGGANTNGAIVVNLGDLPNATAIGTPTDSYGFIRFRGRVK
ncbi:hypothetical protein ACE1AT_29745 [Pelatocladus sp. BLCC-F211]|uniref:DUF7933 domain-containing protein n=1 Tax=Pelatocladus sp. BLCC-F211 TaxID=3342752 RepID=UPI0035B9FA17